MKGSPDMLGRVICGSVTSAALMCTHGGPSPTTSRAPVGWRHAAQGMMETAEGPVLLADIPAIIEGPNGKPKPVDKAAA